MSGGSALVLAVFLATFLELVTERIFGSWLKGPIMVIIPVAAGVGLCWAFQVDFVAELMSRDLSSAGLAISGVIVGMGSDMVHNFVKKIVPRTL